MLHEIEIPELRMVQIRKAAAAIREFTNKPFAFNFLIFSAVE